jgi:Rrf2 family nitric oxide-sensitive transcriptional repressor
VKTSRGRGGGLRLAMPADRIVIGQVVRQNEDDLALAECFGSGACTITGTCRLQNVLAEALAAFFAVLDRYTLADLLSAKESREAARLLGLVPPPVLKPPAKKTLKAPRP